MNRFAQPIYGKVAYIYETELTKGQLPLIFDPGAYWVDVTGKDCEVGYDVTFKEGEGLVFVAPKNAEVTLESARANKIAEMKAYRDAIDDSPVELADSRRYDFDARAREKITLAKTYLEEHADVKNIAWILANGSVSDTTLEDFKEITNRAVVRSSENHHIYARLKNYVHTLKTIAEVEAVTWDSLKGKGEEHGTAE